MARKPVFKRIVPYLYILPAIAVLLAVGVYPLLLSLWVSVHRWTLTLSPDIGPFVGAENYISVVDDPRFWADFQTTAIFMAGSIGMEFTLGLALALALNRKTKGLGVVRTLILLPMMIGSELIVGIIWARMIFSPHYGLLNSYLTLAGIPFIDFPWLERYPVNLLSIIVADVWQWTPFVMLVMLAGLQSLPREPFESAEIDGASGWQTFRYVTLPLLRSTVLVVLIIRLMDTYRIFDKIYTMTKGGAHTESLTFYAYLIGFTQYNIGKASAFSYIMLIVIIAVTMFVVSKSKVFGWR